MIPQSYWVGITIGVFVLGLTTNYLIFSADYDPVDMKFRSQESFDKMMSNNPKMSSNWQAIQDNKSPLLDSEVKSGKGFMQKTQSRDHVGLVIQDPQTREEFQGIFEGSPITEQQIESSAKSSDGSLTVSINSGEPTSGEFLELVEVFHDEKGNIIEHVNHGIHVTQDEDTVLKMSNLHSHLGEVSYYTRMLSSNNPVQVEVMIYGIGMEEPFSGPIDELIVVTIPN